MPGWQAHRTCLGVAQGVGDALLGLPVTQAAAGNRQTCAQMPFPGAQISGNTITLTLQDGGTGDDDVTPNGAMDDPGSPVLRMVVRAENSVTIC